MQHKPMDEREFSQRVLGCRGAMYAAAVAILRSEQDALDAVQDAILKGWRKLPSLREPAFFATWMTRIAVNCAISISRRRKPVEQLPDQLADAPSGAQDLRLDVWRAVANLDEKTRLCAVLYYLEEMSVTQVAQIVGIRQGTVKSRLHRARARLREVLEGYEDE